MQTPHFWLQILGMDLQIVHLNYSVDRFLIQLQLFLVDAVGVHREVGILSKNTDRV